MNRCPAIIGAPEVVGLGPALALLLPAQVAVMSLLTSRGNLGYQVGVGLVAFGSQLLDYSVSLATLPEANFAGYARATNQVSSIISSANGLASAIYPQVTFTPTMGAQQVDQVVIPAGTIKPGLLTGQYRSSTGVQGFYDFAFFIDGMLSASGVAAEIVARIGDVPGLSQLVTATATGPAITFTHRQPGPDALFLAGISWAEAGNNWFADSTLVTAGISPNAEPQLIGGGFVVDSTGTVLIGFSPLPGPVLALPGKPITFTPIIQWGG